jgi:hypothetical protein
MVMRILSGIFAAILVLLATGVYVGERYGTHKPTPGRSGPEIVCDEHYRCTTR